MSRPLLFLAATLGLATGLWGADSTADIERALAYPKTVSDKVFRDHVSPHWLADGQHCWYRVRTGPKGEEYVLVDATSGMITRAAKASELGLPTASRTTSRDASQAIQPSKSSNERTTLRLTNALSEPVKLWWIDMGRQRKDYGTLQPGESRDLSTYIGHVWLFTGAKEQTIGVFETPSEPVDLRIDGQATARPENRSPNPQASPDGRWRVEFADYQLLLRDQQSGERQTLTKDGTKAQPYRGPVAWAPDGSAFVVMSVKDVPIRKVTIVESSPKPGAQPRVESFEYAKPGDPLPQPQPVLVRMDDRQPRVIANDLFPTPFSQRGNLDIRWSPDSRAFTFDYNQRGHQLWRVLSVDAQSGAVRTVVEETSKTFIDYTNKTWRHWLDATHELLWMSERDGWCHLYLYDSATGVVKNQITRGSWVVRKVLRVDEKGRQVWFMAGGVRPGEDPYHQHLCRVNFDGGSFVQLTEGDGNHEVSFSPDSTYFVDRWSRADLPAVVELRRSADGHLIAELERADIAPLLATGWTLPERFVAKGRDGKTDIHGIVVKPSRFDPKRKYPVLEEVYAGPHSAFAPKSFDVLDRLHSLAELGFIVVKADGMGTNHRGKAFHDVAWKNLQDAGFPDRIAWIKAAAATRPWMDLSRVGIFGGSAGGQSAMRALLDHSDFYQAAFADCGCHDNRMDKIWWNEQWMGWPVDDSYIRSSNVEDAAKLNSLLKNSVMESGVGR